MSNNQKIASLSANLVANANGIVTGITIGNLTTSGKSNLGAISNITITGGTSGQAIVTDGTGNLTWANARSVPGGATTQIQFNANGAFAGDSNLTYDTTTDTLNAANISATSYYGNGYNLAHIQGGNVEGEVYQAYQAQFAGNVTQYNQPNITQLGTQTTFSVLGRSNLNSIGNIYISGGANGQVMTTDGNGNLSWSTASGNGGNGEYANNANYANFANIANIANVANSVAVANVVGIGNIATINIDGSASNILYGNGAFAPAPVSYSNANVANYLPTYTGLLGGTLSTNAQPNVTSVGTLTGLTVNGVSNLSNISNVKITGGANGQVIITDGTGNLSFANVTLTGQDHVGFVIPTGGVNITLTSDSFTTFGSNTNNMSVMRDGVYLEPSTDFVFTTANTIQLNGYTDTGTNIDLLATVGGGGGNGGGSSNAAGVTGSIQYNVANAFTGSANLAYNTTLGYFRAIGNISEVTIGRSSTGTANSVSIGSNVIVNGTGSVGVGISTRAAGSNAISMLGSASGANSVAIGYVTTSSSESTVAVGKSAASSGNATIAIGQTATASGDFSISLGANARTPGAGAIAIGGNVTNVGANSVVIGNAAIGDTNSQFSVVIGSGATSNANSAVTIGRNTKVTGVNGIAIGIGANAAAANSVALGQSAAASGMSSVALGVTATATAPNAIAIGSGVNAGSAGSIGIGTSAGGSNNIIIGQSITGTGGGQSIVIGYAANSTGVGEGVVIGANANASGGSLNAIAIGASSKVSAAGGMAIGANAQVSANSSIAIGTNANAITANTIYLGTSSLTTYIPGPLIKSIGTAPASATATGTTGEIRIVSGFIYVCVATNTWQRSALATW